MFRDQDRQLLPVGIATIGASRLSHGQVGHVAPSHRARWPHRRRLETAAALLDDDRLDALLAGAVAFDDLPARLGDILEASAGGLSPVIAYGEAN